MLKFLVKVFRTLYLLNMWMDLVNTLPPVRNESEILCFTISTNLSGHGLQNFILTILVTVLRIL